MRAYERLLKYVTFDTTSDEDSLTIPSTEKQKVLCKALFEEMKEMGLSDVYMDEFGYVYGVLPKTENGTDKKVGFAAHMDTSPAVSGKNVTPSIVEYQGGDIELPKGNTAITEKAFPHLKNYVGKTLIVTDGTTLLGADDKAGISEVLTAMEYFLSHPEVEHGKVSVCFTPDEEIGRGPDKFDLERFDCDYGYTVDGGALGEIEYECFNAAGVKIFVNGVNVHPGSAKNVMKNAVLIAHEFISMLPPSETPAHTEGYEGFYHVGDISGNETLVKMGMIIRDHDKVKFENRKNFVLKVASYLNEKYGEGTIEIQMKDSYYNMKEMVEPHIEIIDNVVKIMNDLGVTPVIVPIRGGTDGAQLSYRGLPCPNLFVGGENFHGVHEFACIEDMDMAVEIIKNIIKEA